MKHVPLRKRLFDLAVAGPALVVLVPVLAVTVVVVALGLGSPVLFRQQRPGFRGRPFHVLKFRTMTEARDQEGNPLSDRERLTLLGRLLRKTSLDELPQLVNVLVGEMSLVGPRPVTEGELKHYGSAASVYLAVRPGLTGPWQVSGRNDVSYATRVAMDEAYVRNFSLWNDIVILLRTPGVVLSKKGAR